MEEPMGDPTQADLFDPRAAAREAIARAARNARPDFLRLAYLAGRYLARCQLEFTSADLRDTLATHYPDVRTHDDRALGPVMQRLQREGVIVKTDRVKPSGRVRNHHRPLAVWRSKVAT
jgi:hypothetical protein